MKYRKKFLRYNGSNEGWLVYQYANISKCIYSLFIYTVRRILMKFKDDFVRKS
jgi:hypothetical protein